MVCWRNLCSECSAYETVPTNVSCSSYGCPGPEHREAGNIWEDTLFPSPCRVLAAGLEVTGEVLRDV